MIKHFLVFTLISLALTFFSLKCGGGDGGGNVGNNGSDDDTVISIAEIQGVTPPNYGETPVTAIAETEQYTGAVSWSDSPVTFEQKKVYTATIALTPKKGYTLTGVKMNFFAVAGAAVWHNSNSGLVHAIFPATGAMPPKVISIAGIPGITAPVLGTLPVNKITDTEQYTGSVKWDGGWKWSPYFGGGKTYTATITLTAKRDYTLTGVKANSFTVAGATSATNGENSGVITVVFPATESVRTGTDCKGLGGMVVYILKSGDTGYVEGEQRGLVCSSVKAKEYAYWSPKRYENVTVGTSEAFGSGASNTKKIIAAYGSGRDYAAGMARAYCGGGFLDWYIPSREEMNKGGCYYSEVTWTSSETSNNEKVWAWNYKADEGMVFSVLGKSGGSDFALVQPYRNF